jgi:hypothetical protein
VDCLDYLFHSSVQDKQCIDTSNLSLFASLAPNLKRIFHAATRPAAFQARQDAMLFGEGTERQQLLLAHAVFGGGSLCPGLPAAERPLSCHLRATDVVANRFVTDGQSVYVYVFQRRYSADSTAKFFLGLENRSAEKVSFSFRCVCVCSVISRACPYALSLAHSLIHFVGPLSRTLLICFIHWW